MKSTNGQEQKILWHSNTDSNETTVTGEWQRFTFSRNGISNSWVGLGLNASVSSVDTADILVYGFQAEQGSFSTSLIPTLNGSTQTRAAETCNGAGTSSILPSEEGILYCEIARPVNDSVIRSIALSDGSASDFVLIQYYNNNIGVVVKVGSATQASFAVSNTDLNFNKIGVAWAVNNFKVYVNGSLAGSDTSGSSFATGTLSEFAFDNGSGGEDYYGKIRDIRVYNTKEMTDSEVDILLTKITS